MLQKVESKMLSLKTVSVYFFTICLCNGSIQGQHSKREFPEGFLFGTATAAYQIEGGWNADGKSESIWDYMTHNNPCITRDCSNGDFAVDSYNQYKRDVEMMRELGLDFYRFSLAWTRILPTSFPDQINEAGVQYYNNLINEMLKYNIQPMITLYHWDLPQKLQEMGGWANPHITDWFADYARVAFEQFGDRVKYWITVNEPHTICHYGYGELSVAPIFNSKGIAEYMCGKNIIVAHAKAYHIYNNEFKPKWNGDLGIALSSFWYEPESNDHASFVETALQFELGQYAHPIFSETGDFPSVMKRNIAAKSAEQGFSRSRLPEFTPDEIELVRGSADFLGINHYTTTIVRNATEQYDVPSYWDDLGGSSYQLDEWDSAASNWLKRVPWGFYKLLTKIREDYGNPTVMITENGFSSFGGLEDDSRIVYYKSYMDAMVDAIEEGSNVTAYTAWSLMDNFEWMDGYTERFGLYEVDYTSPESTRTPRKSAFFYKEILRTRSLNLSYEPVIDVMTIDEGH